MTEIIETDTDEAPASNATKRAAVEAKTDGELVAARSADVSEDASDEHVKVFVLPPGPKPDEAHGYNNEANFAATRQYMMSQGLRPTGDVRLVSVKPFGPKGKSWALTYAVPAVPAERFDFAEVHVVTDNEDPDGDGHVSATKPAASKSTKAKPKSKPAAKAPDKPTAA